MIIGTIIFVVSALGLLYHFLNKKEDEEFDDDYKHSMRR
jgi:hypothetical protein